MATKAQQFRYFEERSKPPKKPQPKKPASETPNKKEIGLANLSDHAAKKALVSIEESRSGKVSRKSTRTSAHRGKNSSVLEYANQQKLTTPASRHSRRG
ncbi:MAG: hypothetical protein K1X64_12280 [Myxococcaceae bacterium]|nr:hypothetical protein [Myxococcaceae bacterium]